MCIGVLFCDRRAVMINASTSALVYVRSSARTTFSFKFRFLLFFFQLREFLFEFVLFVAGLPPRTVGLATYRTLFHLRAFFLRKPPNLAFFFGCTRWIVRIASFAKP